MVVKATCTRLDGAERFIMSNIVEMFGKDVAPNFVVMTTFADSNKP